MINGEMWMCLIVYVRRKTSLSLVWLNMPLFRRPCYDYEMMKSLLKPTGIKSGASYNGRELDTLDCAYLGRLLVYLNEHKRIPRFKPPPHAFPDDFEAC